MSLPVRAQDIVDSFILEKVQDIVNSLFRKMPYESLAGIQLGDEELYAAIPNWLVHPHGSGKTGKIITISSTAGQRGESLHTHYGASKGGIISFTKGLATELARHNILVNCVAPGWVATDMSNPVLETKAGQKMAGTVIPLRRAGTPEEIAGPILFVASDLANFMTGEVINVNGGAVLCG